MNSSFVRLEPHVVDELVRICDTMLKEFDRSKETATRLMEVHGFGDMDSAQQLAAGFRRKAAGTPASAVERIEQFSQALKQLRDAFAAGGEAFLDTEFDWAHRLAATEPDSGAQNGHSHAK